MIVVVATSHLKPEHLPQALNIYRALVTATRKEPGCLRYELVQNHADPNRVAMIEEWADEAALQQHLGSPDFLERVAELRPLVASPSELNRYTPVF